MEVDRNRTELGPFKLSCLVRRQLAPVWGERRQFRVSYGRPQFRLPA